MAENNQTVKSTAKFAGIEVPPDLTRGNFFFLFFNTFLMGIMMSVTAILQPSFLKDIIKISPDFFGSINGVLINLNTLATLALVAVFGALSDRVGRKILAFIGFVLLAISFYLLGQAIPIASFFHVSEDFSSKICAILSFTPSRAAEFTDFAPALLMTYIIRFFIGVGVTLGYPQFIAMTSDYTYGKDRGKGMGLNGLMLGLSAMVIFSALAPLLKATGVNTFISIVCAISLAGAVCSWIFLKDHLPETKEQKTAWREIFRIVKKSVPLKASYMCTLITRADVVIMGGFLLAWAVKAADTYGLSAEAATQKGAVPMIVLSLVSFISFPVVGILLDKWGRVPTIIFALISSGAGMVLLSTCPDPFGGMVLVSMILIAFGVAGSMAGTNTLATDASPPGSVGAVLGGLNTMQPIGVLFFAGLGGYLFDAFSPGWAFGLKGAANLLLCLWFFVIKGQITTGSVQKT